MANFPILLTIAFALSFTIFSFIIIFDNGYFVGSSFSLFNLHYNFALAKSHIISTPFTTHIYNGINNSDIFAFRGNNITNNNNVDLSTVESSGPSNIKDILNGMSANKLISKIDTNKDLGYANTTTANNNSMSINPTNTNNTYAADVDTATPLNKNFTFLSYHDSIDGINIFYPSNWIKIEYPLAAMNYGVGHRIIVNFLTPLNINSTKSTSTTNIGSGGSKWRPYFSIELFNQTDANKLLFQNGTIIDNGILGGHPAYKLIYTESNNVYADGNTTNYQSVKVKVMQVWSTIKDKTFMFTYQAEAPAFSKYLPIVEEMLRTFKTDQ